MKHMHHQMKAQEPGAESQGAVSADQEPTSATSRSAAKGYGLVAAVYLLGLFIGALDMGIVTPARTVIQNGLGVEDQLGVWMLTIYTLAYAAGIPVMGKLADKYGRKIVYLTCVTLFGLGSLFCGLAQDFASFELLIVARAVQALGGGGIMPVATAEFGTAFPEEKRGMALGLVGGVYGLANVFGSSAGSLILDIFGQNNWQFIFYVNVPICLFIIIVGCIVLPKKATAADVRPIDGLGICVMTVMVLSLMYGLKNLDFFDIANSITAIDVYPFLIGFVVLLPIFILVEKHAADPVMNLSYFKNRDIVITLACSIGTGIIMMATIFIPQFCENSLLMRSGAGGYFIIILGLFAGVGSPMSGKFIDKFGVKPVLGFGFFASLVGALYLSFVACAWPNVLNVVVSLILIGLGMGFTMGTPLNYMMLQKTKESESNSALATLSLVRSIGTAIAPAIMVAFVAQAGMNIQGAVMDQLPTQVSVSPLPYAQELDDELAKMRSSDMMPDGMKDLDIPSLTSMQTVDVSMNTDQVGDTSVELSQETQTLMESSDATTITQNTKVLVSDMFGQVKPNLIADATNGLDQGIEALNDAVAQVEDAMSQMPPMAAAPMTTARDDMKTTVSHMEAARDAVPSLFDEAEANYLTEIDNRSDVLADTYRFTLNEGFKGMFELVAACSAVGIVLLLFFRDTKHKNGALTGQEPMTASA